MLTTNSPLLQAIVDEIGELSLHPITRSGTEVGYITEDDVKRIKTRLLLGANVSWAGEAILLKQYIPNVVASSEHKLLGATITVDKTTYRCKLSFTISKHEMATDAPILKKHIVLEAV